MITRKQFLKDARRLIRTYGAEDVLLATLWWMQRGAGKGAAMHTKVTAVIEDIVKDLRADEKMKGGKP